VKRCEDPHFPDRCCDAVAVQVALNVSLNTFLQILSVHSFEKIELFRAFQEVDTENPSPQSNNQLNLFDS